MAKQKNKFVKKIVWDYVRVNDTGKPWTYKDAIGITFVMTIPIIGFLAWIVLSLCALKHRRVIYEEV